MLLYLDFTVFFKTFLASTSLQQQFKDTRKYFEEILNKICVLSGCEKSPKIKVFALCQTTKKTLWVCIATDLQGQFLRWDIIRLVGKFASFEDILICPTTKTVMGQTSLSSQGVNPTASK